VLHDKHSVLKQHSPPTHAGIVSPQLQPVVATMEHFPLSSCLSLIATGVASEFVSALPVWACPPGRKAYSKDSVSTPLLNGG